MAKAKQNCKKFTIVCRGNDDTEIDQAFAEAAKLIKQGCTSGHDSNESGAFYFDVSDNVIWVCATAHGDFPLGN